MRHCIKEAEGDALSTDALDASSKAGPLLDSGANASCCMKDKNKYSSELSCRQRDAVDNVISDEDPKQQSTDSATQEGEEMFLYLADNRVSGSASLRNGGRVDADVGSDRSCGWYLHRTGQNGLRLPNTGRTFCFVSTRLRNDVVRCAENWPKNSAMPPNTKRRSLLGSHRWHLSWSSVEA